MLGFRNMLSGERLSTGAIGSVMACGPKSAANADYRPHGRRIGAIQRGSFRKALPHVAAATLMAGVSGPALAAETHWLPTGGGSWDDDRNWTDRTLPGASSDVIIQPTVAGTVTGPTVTTTVRSLLLGNGTDAATLTLGAGSLNVTSGLVDAISIRPNAALVGGGTLEGRLENDGRVQVNGGQTLGLVGDVMNKDAMRLLGVATNPAELDVTGGLSNTVNGTLFMQSATVSTTRGIGNDGRVQISTGVSNVFGALTNNSDGSVTVSGNATASFSDTVTNEGSFYVGPGSSAAFFGNVTGAGGFTGTGNVDFAGGRHIGNSPAVVTDTVDETYDSTSTLMIDLGGATPGTCDGPTCHAYGQLVFDGSVIFNGGALDVSLYNGFVPTAGEIFNILVYNSTHSGTFGAIDLPTLSAGLSWDVADLYTTGQIGVEGSTVPEPSTWVLIGAGFAGLGFARYRASRKTAALAA